MFHCYVHGWSHPKKGEYPLCRIVTLAAGNENQDPSWKELAKSWEETAYRWEKAVSEQKITIAALESELAAKSAHICHDECQHPLCVARRRICVLEAENAKLRAGLKEIYLKPTDIRRAVEIARKALEG